MKKLYILFSFSTVETWWADKKLSFFSVVWSGFEEAEVVPKLGLVEAAVDSVEKLSVEEPVAFDDDRAHVVELVVKSFVHGVKDIDSVVDVVAAVGVVEVAEKNKVVGYVVWYVFVVVWYVVDVVGYVVVFVGYVVVVLKVVVLEG